MKSSTFAPDMSIEGQFVKITAIEDTEEYNRKNIHQHDYYELVWFTEVAYEDVMQIALPQWREKNVNAPA